MLVRNIGDNEPIGTLETCINEYGHLIVDHCNTSDEHYFSSYIVEGTADEIAVIRQFCKLLTALSK